MTDTEAQELHDKAELFYAVFTGGKGLVTAVAATFADRDEAEALLEKLTKGVEHVWGAVIYTPNWHCKAVRTSKGILGFDDVPSCVQAFCCET